MDIEMNEMNSDALKTPQLMLPSGTLARKVLAPYIKRTKREVPENLPLKAEDPQKNYIRSRVKEVILKLTSFCEDSLETPTVVTETSEMLREVTRSKGVCSYLVDEDNGFIVLNPKYLPKNGRHTVKYKIEPGTYISPYVAFTEEYVVVDDILGDMRFPKGIPGEKKTVKSVLCVPVLTTPDGKCMAVIELFRGVNDEPYNSLDLQICVAMTGWMGAAIHQNKERHFLLKKNELNNYLLTLSEFLFSGALGFDKFISDIVGCAKLAVMAERCSFFLMQEEVAPNSEDDIVADVYEEGLNPTQFVYKKKAKRRYSKNSVGLAGYVARHGKTVNVKNAYDDPRFNPNTDLHGFLTKTVICVPLKGVNGVLGVLQLMNKLDDRSFTENDEILLNTIASYTFLACQHGDVRRQLKKLGFQLIGSEELVKIHMKPCPDDLRLLRHNSVYQKAEMPKGFFSFDWIVIGREQYATNYAVYMFYELLGEQFFDFDKLTEFVLIAKKSYRDNPYHNFIHAFTVFHCMFNTLYRNSEKFTSLQIMALMVATLCHDSDHVGFTNNFLEMTKHWLAELYWESPLENHHYDVCVLMLESTQLFSALTQPQYESIKKLIKFLILSTDLVQFFRNRAQITSLLKTKTFDWRNPEHQEKFLGNLMTVCDVSGQCKPFYTAKKVTEGLYKEFYNQGDVEKGLGFTPLALMDRDKKSTVPENQIQFLSLVCIPSVEILAAVFPNTEELLKQCVLLKEWWTLIIEKSVVPFWKPHESIYFAKRQDSRRILINR